MKYSLSPLQMSIVCLLCFLSACTIKLANTSIPPNVQTYYVQSFNNAAFNAPPDIGNNFSEEFKVFIRRQSRLTYEDTSPDIEFEGSVQRFEIKSITQNNNETTETSRLTISIKVNYIDNTNDKNNWNQSFSHFADFPANQNLADVQDQLITTIFEQLTQDVFNTAFAKW